MWKGNREESSRGKNPEYVCVLMRKGIIRKCDLNRNREIELVVGKETRSKVKT